VTDPAAAPPAPRRSPAPVILLIGVALLIILFASWYSGWWGRPLNDEQIVAALDPSADARALQHALAQLESRLGPTYTGRERFRERMVAMKSHPAVEVRRQLAQVMGREPAPEYRDALKALLLDADPPTRLNAALALSNFNDASGRPALLEALAPVTIAAPAAGKLDLNLKEGDTVSPGRPLGDVTSADGSKHDVRSYFAGYVEKLPAGKAADVPAGAPIAIISPDPKAVANALAALASVGLPEDAVAIEPYAQGKVARMSAEVKALAGRALQAIRSR
jgi:hypothetical protein